MASPTSSASPPANPLAMLGQPIPGQPPPLTGTMPIVNSWQVALIVAPTILYALATAAVGGRIYTRYQKRQGTGMDDFLCIVALIMGYGQHATLLILVLGGGVGLTFLSLSWPTMMTMFKTSVANYLIYVFNIAFVQLSVLFFYVRLFGVKAPFRIACYALIGIIIGWALQAFFTRLLACGTHIHKVVYFIDMTNPEQCVDKIAICASTAILHVIFDASVILLPIPLVWSLKMSVFRKCVISAVLGCGVFATICAILRMDCMLHFYTAPETDITAVLGQALLYQSLETPVGLICICVPTLSPLWTQFTESRIGTYCKQLFTGSSRSAGESDPSKMSSEKEKQTSGYKSNEGFLKLDTSIHDSERSAHDNPQVPRDGMSMNS